VRLDCGGERNGQRGTGGKHGEGKETTGKNGGEEWARRMGAKNGREEGWW
jgi:hypothetical protein